MRIGTNIAGGCLQGAFKGLENSDKPKEYIAAGEKRRKRVGGATRPFGRPGWRMSETFS
jgi:hypothetical protein